MGKNCRIRDDYHYYRNSNRLFFVLIAPSKEKYLILTMNLTIRNLTLLFVCLFVSEATFQVKTGSVSRLRKGAGSTSRKLGQSPYQSATVSSATGILQGFSLRICMNQSGVSLRLHTSHSNLPSMGRPEH